MQFQVPQFIETEDKVVGPFSIRQFMYVGAAALVSALFYFLVSTWLFVILAILFIGGSLAMSFIKIEGRPLPAVIRSAFNFYWKPQTYVWQPDYNPIHEHKAQPQHGGIAVEDLASAITSRKRWEKEEAAKADTDNADGGEQTTLSKVLSGEALHDAWRNVLTGSSTQKTSDKQFFDKKMEQRYHIFQRVGGDREAARRVDYR